MPSPAPELMPYTPTPDALAVEPLTPIDVPVLEVAVPKMAPPDEEVVLAPIAFRLPLAVAVRTLAPELAVIATVLLIVCDAVNVFAFASFAKELDDNPPS